eukprot:7512840-Prorocentrum_lima.AAC.1
MRSCWFRRQGGCFCGFQVRVRDTTKVLALFSLQARARRVVRPPRSDYTAAAQKQLATYSLG